jgi:hypothetical protein
MLRFHVGLWFGGLAQLRQREAKFKAQCDQGLNNETLSQYDKAQFHALTHALFDACRDLELEQPLKRESKIKPYVRQRRRLKLTYSAAYHQLKELGDAILGDMNERIFLGLPSDSAKYYREVEKVDQINPLSSLVFTLPSTPLFDVETKPLEKRFSKRWPNANKEITAAGNCYATGNSTASIFHLMRAVEYGARTLADELKLEVGKDKDIPKPVKKCDWGKLAIGFRKAIDRLPRQTDADDELVAFYNDAAAHFSAVKDLRNRICHTRGRYNQHQAKSVFDNVEHFMKQLSEKLREVVDENDEDAE